MLATCLCPGSLADTVLAEGVLLLAARRGMLTANLAARPAHQRSRGWANVSL
jgi:hypothetical protein